MLTSEIIEELQRLVDKNGDAPFHLYDSFNKRNVQSNLAIFFDDELKDICIGFYPL